MTTPHTQRRNFAVPVITIFLAALIAAVFPLGSSQQTAHATSSISHSVHPESVHQGSTYQGTFAGIVALSNCSGAIVKTPHADERDGALVLSNGHCLEEGFPKPGEVITNKPSQRTFELLSADGQSTVATLRASQILYATMTSTDVAVYQLNTSYAQLKKQHNVDALALSDTRPSNGTHIDIISGYWKTKYSCSIDSAVPQLREDAWTWQDSVRYSPECKTVGGTSGSPIIDRVSGKVIGVNNTSNENGEKCTINNPCEVDNKGTVTVRRGANYGQQTYPLANCLARHDSLWFDPSKCALAT